MAYNLLVDVLKVLDIIQQPALLFGGAAGTAVPFYIEIVLHLQLLELLL